LNIRKVTTEDLRCMEDVNITSENGQEFEEEKECQKPQNEWRVR